MKWENVFLGAAFVAILAGILTRFDNQAIMLGGLIGAILAFLASR